MIIVEYDPDYGDAVRDGDVESEVEAILNGGGRYAFATENIFQALRLAVLRDMIDWRDIAFRFNGQDLLLNEYGNLVDKWPPGFLDQSMEQSEALLKEAIAKRKRLKKERA